MERTGFAVTLLPVAARTVLLDGAALTAALRPDTFLVSVMLANNEIGTIQDIPAIAAAVRGHGAVLHVDCAQALGRMDLNVDAL